jgi:uncharacterized protein (DUF2236 family)
MDMRQSVRDHVRSLVGSGDGLDLDAPKGDPGLFGPGSVAWKVHGDFSTMMVGGISALLLQMLHPGAFAGVWEHSTFRRDMQGRLQRTARFIAGTTYAGTDEALRLIARVRAVHAGVRGVLPDGRPYSANDPDLITFVHVAEVSSFLAAYLRYGDPALSDAAQDRYFAETAKVARLLGATDVPETRAEVRAYFRDIRPALRADARVRQTAKTLLLQRSRNAVEEPFRLIAMEAGKDLLPDWAAQMHGFCLGALRRQVVRVEAQAIRSVIRWALHTGSASRAERRVAAGPHPSSSG